MIRVQQIFITQECIEYLQKRQLEKSYLKAKRLILQGSPESTDLKMREPKEKGVWYFQINRQYRAHAFYEDGILRVYRIDDHSR